MSQAHHSSLFDPVEQAVQDIADGKLIVVTDDESRENEGDLVMAASRATPETVNTMIRFARGLICVPTTSHQLKRLGISQMVLENRESHKTDFSVSVDAAEGITTGISAYDRCRTIRLLADPDSTPDALVQPGHVFPLKSKPGGVLERAGHTEAAVDLASLAGLHPSGVICEILNDDGTCARLPELLEFKRRHGLTMISIASLIEYRHQREQLVEEIGSEPFPSEFGEFTLHAFRSRIDGRQHFAFCMGQPGPEPTLVRVHSENLFSDVFRKRGLDSFRSLTASFGKIAAEGRGVVLYMQTSGGSLAALKPSFLVSTERDAEPMSLRDYGIGAQILAALGLNKIRLLSSTSRRVVALDAYGLEIVEQVPLG
jgi:3,4-dihydroxy 2-butanone 4-phosphate synthase / GTP cyclohydrolase II